jgi:hypothetical protein
MARYAARGLGDMVDNTSSIVGIKALAAAQGIEFGRLKSGPGNQPNLLLLPGWFLHAVASHSAFDVSWALSIRRRPTGIRRRFRSWSLRSHSRVPDSKRDPLTLTAKSPSTTRQTSDCSLPRRQLR